MSEYNVKSESLNSLPDFGNPPVVETVLSAQFEPIAELQTAHLGLLWAEYRDTFPKTEERPPLEPIIERFPEALAPRLGLRLHSLEKPPVPRLSFTNEHGNEMIQVQTDRFIKNWRKEEEAEQYPRYKFSIRPKFDRDFKIFNEFLAKNKLGAPQVNQCEVAYVNHIVSGEGWDRFAELHRIFTFWQSPSGIPPGPIEDVRINLKFVIPNDQGKPIGRLYVDVQPAVRVPDNRPMYVLHLVARGQIGSSLEFFDIGREWIVRTFKALTTDPMHHIWRMKKGGNSVS